ncbi:MAG: hypothetical protein DWQ10_00980 [Calditrichaeota bacterium]|nr:MAG: hypothetical protein DWQ10_00980 [Calditrichota bacterium]
MSFFILTSLLIFSCSKTEEDPHEMNNLMHRPEYQEHIKQLRKALWDWLEQTGGMQTPLKRSAGPKLDYRNKGYF